MQEESKILISDWAEFISQLKYHFQSEGQEFDSSNYPYKMLHNSKHNELLGYLPLFEQKKTADGILVDFDDLRLLRQSILDHVEVLDMEMPGYLD